MHKFLKYLYRLLPSAGLLVVLGSCSQEEPNDSPYVDQDQLAESTLLIYAVATNSLSANLGYDKTEMLMAADKIDLENNNVLICQTVYEYDEVEMKYTGEGETSLIKLAPTSDPLKSYDWEVIKHYSNNTAPLNPLRISEVIDYTVTHFPAESYGLVLWSHSTASQPYFPASTEAQTATQRSSLTSFLPALGSFGEDKTTNEPEYSHLNIDDLSLAIPDHLFDYIWFDSCLMSNIESIYQFRNKCNTYIAYPTEVLDDGLPYNLVLPYMVGEDRDLVKAAQEFYKYYSATFGTVAVIDMAQIESLADFCKDIFSSQVKVSSSGLTKYSRYNTGPFYDFGQYLLKAAEIAALDITKEDIDEKLSESVIYKATTSRNYLPQLYIDTENYSGVSAHVYALDEVDAAEIYYRSLDWYRDVF